MSNCCLHSFQPGDPGLTAPKCSSWQSGNRLHSSPRRNSPSDLGWEDGPDDDDDENDCGIAGCSNPIATVSSHLLLSFSVLIPEQLPALPRSLAQNRLHLQGPGCRLVLASREKEMTRALASLTSSSFCILTCALVPHSFSEGKDTRAEEHLHFQGARLDPTAEGSHRDRSIESRRASEESEPAAKPRCRQVKTERPASRRPAKKRQPGCPQSPQCTLTAFFRFRDSSCRAPTKVPPARVSPTRPDPAF